VYCSPSRARFRIQSIASSSRPSSLWGGKLNAAFLIIQQVVRVLTSSSPAHQGEMWCINYFYIYVEIISSTFRHPRRAYSHPDLLASTCITARQGKKVKQSQVLLASEPPGCGAETYPCEDLLPNFRFLHQTVRTRGVHALPFERSEPLDSAERVGCC
jgi:hypothetical protein